MLLAQLGQARAQGFDTLADQPAVGLELGFARAAQADTALLPFQVSPAANQTRGQVLQLRQFHLQLALVGGGALGENVEDQAGAVQHPDLQALFQVALLGRRQRVVEDDDLDLVVEHADIDAFFEVALLGRRQRMVEDDDVDLLVDAGLADFVSLAAADEIRRVRGGTLGRDRRHRFRAC